MADSSPQAGLLDRAASLLPLVGELADAIRENERWPDEETQQRAAAAWKALRPAIIEAGASCPPEANPLADWIRDVGRAAQRFDRAVRQHGLAEVLFSRNCEGFLRVAEQGQTLWREMTAKRDPFAFVDAPAASNAAEPNAAEPNAAEPNAAEPNAAEPWTVASPPRKAKRSTERGEGRIKLIAALTMHHQYGAGGCLNREPVGNNELARLAEVSESTASAFFHKQFGGHTQYRAMCAEATRLVAALKLLNQEFSPHHLFGAKPPGEGERRVDD
jgi:hypothetical protein